MPTKSKTRLARVLEDQGRKQVWLAEQIGVSDKTIGRWVRGEWPVPKAFQFEIARVLGLKRTEIFEERKSS